MLALLLGARRRVYGALDRTGGRGALALLGTAYVTARRGQFCRVRYQNGAWVHAFGGMRLVAPQITATTPDEMAALVNDGALFGYVPKLGDTVVDVGAGVGTETLVYARNVGPSGCVVAIEAHPETFRCLRLACRLNGLDNVVPLDVAITDRRGEIVISDRPEHVTNSIVDSRDGGFTVRARTLDEVAAELSLDRVDLLKVNIEGAELLALSGMANMIKVTRNIVVHCHDFLAAEAGEGMRTKSSVRRLLETAGFDTAVREDHAHPWVRDTVYGRRPS